MKTITALVMGCSLAIAGAVFAQTAETQESPAAKGGKHGQKSSQETTGETKGKGNAGETRGGKGRGPSAESNANATQPTTSEAGGAAQGGRGRKGRGANASGAGAETSPATSGGATNAATDQTAGGKKGRHGRNAGTTAETGASGSPATGASASPAMSAATETGKKGKHGRGANAQTAASPATSAAPSASASAPMTSASPATSATAAAGATGATGTNAATTTTTNATAGGGNLKGQGTVGRGGKRVEQQQVQQIKQQHASFKAQPRPDKAPAVTFQQNYRISGADSWQGPQYEVFRSYHPEWHDRNWYHQRYHRVELIGGGYYYFNNGYWYPAWGYDPGNAYYAYDAPIYVGHRAQPPDQVIADVQAELQDMGYYTGEVDGLLGPLTRQALRDYQADHGLMVTEVIDEPTLDALQLS